MSNLFNILGGGQANDMMSQFAQFRKTFTGDPKQQVQAMLLSGQLSNEQFNQLARKATELRKMMPR